MNEPQVQKKKGQAKKEEGEGAGKEKTKKRKVAPKPRRDLDGAKQGEVREEKDTLVSVSPPSEGGPQPSKKPERYFEAVGRRKTAVARVRLYTKAGEFLVNDKPYQLYFSTQELQKDAEDALQKMKLSGRFKVTVKVSGGGLHAQAEAIRHGLARALTKFNPDFRKRLRRVGFLTRDPRMKERKKFGLKKARKAPQWAKR